jgi:hypothetical protein
VLRQVRWLVLVVALLLVGAALVAASRKAASGPGPISSRAAARSTPPPPSLARAPAPAPAASGSVPAPAPVLASAPLPPIDEAYPVKLEALRAEIPRNRYWLDSAPTKDPEVIARREREAAAWNELYGKVLSGTATTDEIRTCVDHRRQVSEDAIEFAQRVLAEHGSELPDRDRGLLELAIEMHSTRLAELPRQESEARARKDEQDRRRAVWNGATTP